MGESIGLFANETQLASYASKELGLDWKTLDEAGKQVARLEYAKAMQEAAGATGQASRESDSLENQLGNLRQVWDDLKAKFGAPILAPAVAGIQKLSEWLQKVDTTKITGFFEWAVGKLPIVQGIFSQVFGVISDVTGRVWEFFKSNILPVFVQLFEDVQANFPVIQQFFQTVFDTILEVATTVWNFFKTNVLPIFMSMYLWVQGHMPTIRATFQTVFSKVVEVASKVWTFFKNNILPILQRFLGFIQSNMPTIQRIVENVFKIISNVVKAAWEIFENLLLPVLKALWDYIVAPAFSKIQTIIEKVFKGIFKAVDTVVGVFEAVTGAIQKALDWLTFWDNKKVSKKTIQVEEQRTTRRGGAGLAFATGTNYAPGGVALVGERGPELVHLPRGSKVKTANETRQLLGESEKQIVISPAPIYLDNTLVGEVLFNAIDNQFNTNAQMQLYMKGARR